MERLLSLNKYLPARVRTDDVNKLIDLFETILSTGYIIDHFPEDEEPTPLVYANELNKLRDLPSEIAIEILSANHPYYLSSYCSTDAYTSTLCKNNIYTLFKKWCAPNLSEAQIKSMLPNLTFNQLKELSLAYHPIPESLDYWDRMTLFYHACVQDYDNADTWLHSEKFKMTLSIYILSGWICYKFARDDLWEKITTRSYPRLIADSKQFYIIIQSLIRYKKGLVIDKNAIGNINVEKYMVTDNLFAFMNNLFSYEETIDLVLSLTTIFGPNALYNILLQGDQNSEISPNLAKLAILYSARQIGKARVLALMKKHNLNDVIRVDYNNYSLDSQEFVDEVFTQLWSRQVFKITGNKDSIPVKYRGMYYLTSGDLLNYVKYGYPNLAGNRNYYQINQFGQTTFNKRSEPQIDSWNYSDYERHYRFSSTELFFSS